MIAIVDKLGKIVKLISCPPDQVALNTPPDCIAVDDAPSTLNYRYKDGEFIPLGDKPSPNHEYDYQLEQWVDPRAFRQIQDERWLLVKFRRKEFEDSGFTFEGRKFDSDADARQRIMTVIFTGDGIQWQDKDNEQVVFSEKGWSEFKQALSDHITTAHIRAQALREQIYAAKIVEDLPEVIFP